MPPSPRPNYSAVHKGVKIAQYPHNHFQIKAWAALYVPTAMSGSDQGLFCHADGVRRDVFSYSGRDSITAGLGGPHYPFFAQSA